MARLDPVARCTAADMAALFWWRRNLAANADGAGPAPRTEATPSLAEPAARTPPMIDLPGNRLRANAAAARAALAAKAASALSADRLAALRAERREALAAFAIGLIATAIPVAAAVCAAIVREPVALGFAILGGVAASFALYHAARWLLLMRADAPPNFLA